jgi:hypothetical protein
MPGFVHKYIKKIQNLFHIPGEDVIILGLDDRNQSARLYDLYVRTASRFSSNLENKSMEGNQAKPWLWYPRLKLQQIFYGEPDRNDPNIVHVNFDIDKRDGCIFKTEDKPEGVMYLFDMATGQGAQLVSKTIKIPEPKPKVVVDPAQIDTLFVAELEESPTAEVTTKIERIPVELAGTIIPRQIKLHRDPVLDLLVSINPYMIGSMIDSFIATELLRGKVEFWKTALMCAGCLIMGLLIGMAIK